MGECKYCHKNYPMWYLIDHIKKCETDVINNEK